MSTTDTPFSSLGLAPDVLSAIEAAGFTSPTAVQAEGIPAFLGGGDILIQAQTGTGKTAAFVLPIIQQLEPKPGTIEVLVLAPTRELAKQVCGEFSHFGGPRGINATPIYGGTSFEKQFDALETAQVVVATPGRLLDLLRRKKFDPRNIVFFGLDEADELLSMGFEKDVLDIVAQIAKPRQAFICSATINPAIQRIAQNFITDPTIVDVSSDEIGAKSVRHETFRLQPSDKLEALRRLVHTDARDGAIVFANTRAATFLVTDALAREDVTVDVLNGDLSQAEREKALSRMKNDSVRFLVATDVAARGIDISGLPAVINYDMPESPDVYIHRTGRTGRAGQAGVAYSLVCPSDISVFHQLQKFYKLEFHDAELPSRDRMRSVVADELIADVLDGLDADARLEYAARIPLARRLAAREDGARVIAKLIAHFESGAVTTKKNGKAAVPADATPIEDIPPRASAKDGSSSESDSASASESDSASVSESDSQSLSESTEAAPVRDTASPISLDALESALNRASRQRGRWRGTRSLAKELDVEESDVVAALEANEDRFEASRKKPGQWRMLRTKNDDSSSDAPAPKATAEAKKSAKDEGPRRSRRRRSRDDDDSAEEAPKAAKSESKPEKKKAAKPKAEKPAPSSKPDGNYVTLTLNVGADHGAEAGALTEELVLLAGLDPEDVGRVLIEGDSSKVDVIEDYWEDMLQAIDGQTVFGQTIEAKGPKRRGRKR